MSGNLSLTAFPLVLSDFLQYFYGNIWHVNLEAARIQIGWVKRIFFFFYKPFYNLFWSVCVEFFFLIG